MMQDPHLVRAILRSDFYCFIQATFPTVSPGAAFAANWHIEAIAFALTRVLAGEIKRLIITVPPRSLKSICTSVAFPAFVLGHDARESTKQWYANTLLSRLDDKVNDAIIVVMQRLHPDDLVGHLLEQDGWTHLNLPAIAETKHQIPIGPALWHLRQPGDVLHPEREPRAILDEFKRSMGSLDFAAQYQQEPVAEGGNLIKWKWFSFYDDPPARQADDRIVISWDTAMSSKELSSYSACVVLQIKGESAYVLDVIRERLEYPDLKRKVFAVYRNWRNACSRCELVIENKGSGMSLIQELKRENIHAIAIDPEGDKAMRMKEQTARIEAGSVFLPSRAGWLDDFRREILAFPAGRYTDQVDAFSQALKRAFTRRGEVLVGFIGVDGVIPWSHNRGRVRAFDASRGGCIPSPNR